MARIVLANIALVLMVVLSGCTGPDSGKSQLIPARVKEQAPVLNMADAAESDIVEQLAVDRQAYRQSLETLIAYYENTGNRMNLGWAQNELAALDAMPQYIYLIEAGIAGPDLRATASIPVADYAYQEALSIENKAGSLLIVKNEDMLRTALDKYNQLIARWPNSDKIDDAAFRAGKICEYFRDYSVALVYYTRTYQWDPQTPHPAQYRAAYIQDQYMMQRDDALQLYRSALEGNTLNPTQAEWTKQRVAELTKVDEKLD